MYQYTEAEREKDRERETVLKTNDTLVCVIFIYQLHMCILPVTGRSKGYAFVEFRASQEAEEAAFVSYCIECSLLGVQK